MPTSDAPDFAQPLSGTATQQKVHVSSSVNASVNVQHNGALVAGEPAVDFEDATGFGWTVTDDPGGSRVKVTPSPHPYSSQAASFPGSPLSGDTFWIIRNNTTMPFVYDGTHWYSPVFSSGNLVSENGVTQTDVGTAAYIGTASGGTMFDGADLTVGSAATLYGRVLAFVTDAAGKAAKVQLGVDGSGAIAGTEAASNASGTAQIIAGPWAVVTASTGTPRWLAYGYRTSGGVGISVTFSQVTAEWRWVK